jgi:hypothetical protein
VEETQLSHESKVDDEKESLEIGVNDSPSSDKDISNQHIN